MACKEGYYELISGSGICLPNSATLAQEAGNKVGETLLTSVATSPGVVTAGKNAAISATSQNITEKVVRFVKDRPIVSAVGGMGVAALLYYGVKSVLSKK